MIGGLVGQLPIYDGQNHIGEIDAQFDPGAYDVTYLSAKNAFVEGGVAVQELHMGVLSSRGRCLSSGLRYGLSIDWGWRLWYPVHDDEM